MLDSGRTESKTVKRQHMKNAQLKLTVDWNVYVRLLREAHGPQPSLTEP
jgi:hypothetical protein